MRDFLHQEIKVGDFVAYNPPTYKDMVIGKVKRLTPKGVTCIHRDWRNNETECNRPIDRVIRVTEQVALAKEQNAEYYI